MGGWMDGWMDVESELRIAYSKQKLGKSWKNVLNVFGNFSLNRFIIEVKYENDN